MLRLRQTCRDHNRNCTSANSLECLGIPMPCDGSHTLSQSTVEAGIRVLQVHGQTSCELHEQRQAATCQTSITLHCQSLGG